jgi:hypothetical protein
LRQRTRAGQQPLTQARGKGCRIHAGQHGVEDAVAGDLVKRARAELDRQPSWRRCPGVSVVAKRTISATSRRLASNAMATSVSTGPITRIFRLETCGENGRLRQFLKIKMPEIESWRVAAGETLAVACKSPTGAPQSSHRRFYAAGGIVTPSTAPAHGQPIIFVSVSSVSLVSAGDTSTTAAKLQVFVTASNITKPSALSFALIL